MDETYFSSYASLSVHELMLKDAPRTEAYKSFIEKNASAIKDKIVIDVGAGTGILSLFAAKAGAKQVDLLFSVSTSQLCIIQNKQLRCNVHEDSDVLMYGTCELFQVYAIEASELAVLCRDIVEVNGYSDVIQVFHSRVEDCELPIDSCDVIISEWMGFYLLHEAMLESVIFARNKWLSLDGIMIPSSATLYLCPVNLKQYVKENLSVWDNLYGFDFSPFKELVKHKHNCQPSVLTLTAKDCIAEPEEVLSVVLKFVDAEDLQSVTRPLEFELSKHALCHGFAAWFSCGFEVDTKNAGDSTAVTLATGPDAPPTHWQQTVVVLPDALMLSKGERIGCVVTLQQDSTNHRHYNISIDVVDDDDTGSAHEDDASPSDVGDTDAQNAERLIAQKMIKK